LTRGNFLSHRAKKKKGGEKRKRGKRSRAMGTWKKIKTTPVIKKRTGSAGWKKERQEKKNGTGQLQKKKKGSNSKNNGPNRRSL